MLVRRVAPKTQTKRTTIYGVKRTTEDVGESRFGNYHEDANPECVITGIVERIPRAQIVPTARFWDEVATPLDKVELSRLFESPMLEHLHEWNVDVLVLSHNMAFDLESFFLEMIAGGIYTDRSEETSSAIVINFRTSRLLESVSVSGATQTMAAHTLLFVPAYNKEFPAFDVCGVVAERAADAITSKINSSAPTILVLVTASDPHSATQAVAAASRDLAEGGDIEASKVLLKLTGETTEGLIELAESGDLAAATLLATYKKDFGPLRSSVESGNSEGAGFFADEFDDYSYLENLDDRENAIAAYMLYKRHKHLSRDEKVTTEYWRLLCNAANWGYMKAQTEIGVWHQQNTWFHLDQQSRDELEEIGVRPDNQIAYMWFAVAEARGATAAQLPNPGWRASVLTADERAQAEQMARDWKPGDCPSKEHRFGQAEET